MTNVPDLKTMPQDEHAERALIGSVLVLPELLDELAQRVTTEDYFYASPRAAWRAMLALAARGDAIDELTLRLELKAMGVEGGPADDAWLFSTRNLSADSPAAAYNYADKVREYSQRRLVLKAAHELAARAVDLKVTVDTALALNAQALEQVTTAGGSQTLAQVYGRVFDEYGKPDTNARLPTGIAALDDQLAGGIKRRKLVIPAARPGVGKTAFMLHMAYTLASRGVQVGFVSMEMDDEEISDRLTALESRIPQTKLRSPLGAADVAKLTAAHTKFTVTTFGNSFHLVYDGDMTMERLRALGAVWARQGVVVVFVDYIQLLEDGGLFRPGDRVATVSYFSRNLKRMAMRNNLAVIAASQFSRDIEKRADKRPVLSDLRESGSLEQDADLVLLLNRRGLYDDVVDKRVLDIDVAKHRAGESGGMVTAWLELETGRILSGVGKVNINDVAGVAR